MGIKSKLKNQCYINCRKQTSKNTHKDAGTLYAAESLSIFMSTKRPLTGSLTQPNPLFALPVSSFLFPAVLLGEQIKGRNFPSEVGSLINGPAGFHPNQTPQQLNESRSNDEIKTHFAFSEISELSVTLSHWSLNNQSLARVCRSVSLLGLAATFSGEVFI